MTLKASLRTRYLKIRDAISLVRQEIAEQALYAQFEHVSGSVLSFSSMGSEIANKSLNQLLAKRKQLVLPRCAGPYLQLYSVSDLAHLQLGSYGLLEPNLAICPEVQLSTVDVILVPGIVFDADGYRIGYGKGYYDRLLAVATATTIGVGFLEQKIEGALPIDSWDVPVQKLFLT